MDLSVNEYRHRQSNRAGGGEGAKGAGALLIPDFRKQKICCILIKQLVILIEQSVRKIALRKLNFPRPLPVCTCSA